MPEYSIMAYNIEWMNNMFAQGVIKPSQNQRAQSIASVIQKIGPSILGISEAANDPGEHQHFINHYLPGAGYQLAHGTSRGAQNLVFYYRSPLNVVSVDQSSGYHAPWSDDIDEDKISERFKWDRKPLEVVFRIGSGGPELRVILVHTKSKGVFDVVDFHQFEKLALANRKKLLAQARRLRSHLDELLAAQNPLPTIVLGDMNDGPGMDPFERMLGRSFVEALMGSVFEPQRIFHNTLRWMTRTRQDRKNLWTADFLDPIVTQARRWKHRVWIDHILVSPDMLDGNNPVRYKMDSGRIGEKNATSRKASDHFPVSCEIIA